ncbi:MAG: cell wall metabolism sensor histidine kinase WalK [Phycisphaerales bacterium]|nr:cell wall metabolism sensor histidine kinase WalK [Phycisphaerales bacterium]
MFQTLTRTMLSATAFTAAAVAGGCLVSWLLGSAMPWPSLVGAGIAAGTMAAVALAVVARSSGAFRARLESTRTAEAVASAPRWLRPTARTLVGCLERMAVREDAWKTRERDLEIRARVAESGREQAEAVLAVMDEAVLVVNEFQEVVVCNAAAGRLLSCDSEAAPGRPLSDIVQDSTLRRIIVETMDAQSTGVRQAELMLGEGADAIACEATVGCILDQKDRVSAAVAVLHDLTREREIAQMKSEFVSKASHELRTPLSSMRACVEMLVDGEAQDEGTREDFYGIIQTETERLARLVDNMLNISRIEAGIIEIDRTRVDLGSVLEQAVRTIEPQASEKGQTLHADLSPVDLNVSGDCDMLLQVVVNLLSNAVKYTPEGGRIVVTADSDNLARCVHVGVQDTGLGIPPADVDRIFEKFYRVENYKRVAKGTGLGLNLCRHIVETVHGGQIGLESTLGMGSRFWFTVPMGRVEAPRVAA